MIAVDPALRQQPTDDFRQGQPLGDDLRLVRVAVAQTPAPAADRPLYPEKTGGAPRAVVHIRAYLKLSTSSSSPPRTRGSRALCASACCPWIPACTGMAGSSGSIRITGQRVIARTERSFACA